MRLVIRDALRRLCVKAGWSYAVFWRTVALQEQRYLIWEDGYCGGNPSGMSGFEAMDLFIKEKGLRASRGEGCLVEPGHPTEDRIYTLVHKRMATQVHIEGNGVVGKVALTGIHKWILHNHIDNNCSAFKDLVELNQQLLAGIHTSVVIPVPPLGVVQLGSSQSIFEEVGFVKYVQQLFRKSINMTQAHLCDVSTTNLNHMLQLSDSIQSSGIQYGNARGNMSTSPSLTLHRKENKPLRGHDTQFITKPSCVFTSPLNKVLVPFQQKSFDNGVKRMMLPSSTFSQSSCHAISNESHNDQLKRVTEFLGHPATTGHNLRIMEQDLPYQSAHVNDILSPDHLKFVKNQFKSYHKTRNESADNHAVLVDSTESLNLRTDEFILPNSVNDCESASSFGRSGSSNMAVSIGNSAKLSGGIMECVKGIISPDGDILQNPSPTDDLDSIFMVSHDFSWNHSTTTGEKSGTMSSIGKENHGSKICQSLDPVLEIDIHSSCDRLTNSSNPDTWRYESGLARLNKQDPPNDFHALANCQNSAYVHNTEMLHSSCIKRISEPHQQYKERELFDLLGLDQISNFNHSYLDGSFISSNSMGVCDMTTGVPNCTSQIDATTFGDEILCSGGLFSECVNDQLLDAIFSQVKPTCKSISDDNVSCNTALTKMSIISVPNKSLESNELVLSDQLPKHFVGQPSNTDKFHTSIKSECNIDRSGGICTLKEENYISEINQRVGKDRSMKCDIISAVNCRVDEVGKMNKRVRPGENSRPRPKDRQLIQDRVKELREIVPNGAKMSIDALLEKTIKHMLFLQSVTNLADKLKETGKPKIISKDEGVLLNDNFKGGATWAYEVGSQSVFCPIVVEDLSTPRHMLVEMICEKKGFFLEIADSIRGLGLTILKGIMEARDDKVWARFTVEANRDVTRMEVFLFLVHLLEPAAGNAGLEGDHSCKNPHDSPHHSSIPWTGAADCL